VFKTTKTEVICGGEVTKGKLVSPAIGKVMRGDDIIAEVEITGLKRGPQEAKEIIEGEMCGLSFRTTSKVDLQLEDRIEFIKREVVERSL
jgi:translation initiation factor IF-2